MAWKMTGLPPVVGVELHLLLLTIIAGQMMQVYSDEPTLRKIQEIDKLRNNWETSFTCVHNYHPCRKLDEVCVYGTAECLPYKPVNINITQCCTMIGSEASDKQKIDCSVSLFVKSNQSVQSICSPAHDLTTTTTESTSRLPPVQTSGPPKLSNRTVTHNECKCYAECEKNDFDFGHIIMACAIGFLVVVVVVLWQRGKSRRSQDSGRSCENGHHSDDEPLNGRDKTLYCCLKRCRASDSNRGRNSKTPSQGQNNETGKLDEMQVKTENGEDTGGGAQAAGSGANNDGNPEDKSQGKKDKSRGAEANEYNPANDGSAGRSCENRHQSDDEPLNGRGRNSKTPSQGRNNETGKLDEMQVKTGSASRPTSPSSGQLETDSDYDVGQYPEKECLLCPTEEPKKE